MKIVVDANLFASGLIKPKSNPGKILDLIKHNQVELILSPLVIRKIKRIFLYPRLQKYHHKTAQEIDAYFEDVLMFAWIVEGDQAVNVISDDPSDNKYLACAYEGEADYIVSGDHHLLDIEAYKGIRILNAKSFLNVWENLPGPPQNAEGFDESGK
ncbi:MAG: putative toxin-antitoxin system toxin component, PIN family [Dissulfuribacterales bacterium]